jgi:hypothetical protein
LSPFPQKYNRVFEKRKTGFFFEVSMSVTLAATMSTFQKNFGDWKKQIQEVIKEINRKSS